MHFKWNYEPPTSERQTAAKELGEKIGMSPILAESDPRRPAHSARHQDGERSKAVLPSYAK